MATKNNSTINLIDLDQQSLKNDLRNYLRGQDQFKDYDFKGSSMNVLLDLLSYNTFKNAFYLNMAFSERWLDSAQLQSSIFSHAKDVNYLPRSVRSAKAKVRINFEASGDNQPYIIQKGSQFSTIVKSKSLTFTIPETIILSSADTKFEFTADIYEGIYVKESYVMTSGTQRFRISNKNIDTQSLSVVVFEDNSTEGDLYKQATTLLDLDETSKVFFIQTSEIGNYEIVFGDNIVGKKPKTNSIVVLDYRISLGLEGNGAKTFSVDFDPTNSNELLSTPELEVIEASSNGADAETNDSIKYYAPRHYQVQERTVVADDYAVSLKQAFPEINAVSVFGGEELTPPIFGKVFISIDIKNIDGLPPTKLTEYYNYLKKRAPFSITPSFIEPEIIYLNIDTLVRYNINITTNTINRMKAIITDTILKYNETELNDFNVKFRNSFFSKLIDDSDLSIVSNITKVAAYKKINPKLNMVNNFTIDFGFSIVNNLPQQAQIYPIDDLRAVFSSLFVFQNQLCTIEDDGNGILRIVRTSENNKISLVNVGTVDYTSGRININNFNISSYDDNGIKLFVIPEDNDIIATKNNIMLIEPNDITLTIETIRE